MEFKIGLGLLSLLCLYLDVYLYIGSHNPSVIYSDPEIILDFLFFS